MSTQRAEYISPNILKLDFLVDKVCLLQSWTGKIPQVVTRLNEAYDIIDNMTCEMTVLKDQLCEQNLRLIDAEARSRRNNLLFSNIPETDHETDEDCEAALFRFFKEHLRVGDTNSNNIIFQRVHRLGRKKPGVAANGQAWRPRQIIAGFRDYKARQDILLRAKHLRGTQFSINQDFPPEIRTARGQLWDDYKRARSEKLKIAFPAKLVVEEQVVRDLFPMWGNWAKSSTPTQYDDRAASQEPPRSGAPMQVAMADLIGAAPFKPRNNPANPNNVPTPQKPLCPIIARIHQRLLAPPVLGHRLLIPWHRMPQIPSCLCHSDLSRPHDPVIIMQCLIGRVWHSPMQYHSSISLCMRAPPPEDLR